MFAPGSQVLFLCMTPPIANAVLHTCACTHAHTHSHVHSHGVRMIFAIGLNYTVIRLLALSTFKRIFINLNMMIFYLTNELVYIL